RHETPGDLGYSRDRSERLTVNDDDVDTLESEILDEDLADPGDPRERARMENAARLLADQVLIGELAAADFSGVAFDIAITELASYGIAVLMAAMRTGTVIGQCARKGRPLADSEAVRSMSRDDRLEVAAETIARALRLFIGALKDGRWDHRKGATLRTYFIGACLLQLPNVFSTWVGEQRRWGHLELIEPGDEDAAGHPDARSDPTAAAVIRSELTAAMLADITDPLTRKAAERVMHGYSYAEAGEAAGLSATAVEGRLYRLRKGRS
ncbi:MAG: hypothetical protein ACRDN0_09065, partial [Trebonia sp.]